MAWLAMLLACGGGEPTAPPWTVESLQLHPDEAAPWPDDAPVDLRGTPTPLGERQVVLDGELLARQADCDPWPLPPLLLADGRWSSSAALPPVEQRLELTLDAAQGLVRLERVIDSPQSEPSVGWWPADWTLEAWADGRAVALPRTGDQVLWPAFQRLVLQGDGPLPPPNRIDAQGLALWTADLVPDRRAASTGLSLVGGPFHLEPGRGQRTAGAELVATGVRFPHHAGRDGIRVLANDAEALGILDQLLALRDADPVPWPRPLFVVPGPRHGRVGEHLSLGPPAWTDEAELRRALWHLRDMDAELRRAFQALGDPPPPPSDPGCYGLRSRPALDRSRLLAQVVLLDPDAHTAGSWDELETRHPWLGAWLDAPLWPRLKQVDDGDTVRWVDTADTGLELRLPVWLGEERRLVGLGEALPKALAPRLDTSERLPAHR